MISVFLDGVRIARMPFALGTILIARDFPRSSNPVMSDIHRWLISPLFQRSLAIAASRASLVISKISDPWLVNVDFGLIVWVKTPLK